MAFLGGVSILTGGGVVFLGGISVVVGGVAFFGGVSELTGGGVVFFGGVSVLTGGGVVFFGGVSGCEKLKEGWEGVVNDMRLRLLRIYRFVMEENIAVSCLTGIILRGSSIRRRISVDFFFLEEVNSSSIFSFYNYKKHIILYIIDK